MGSTGVVLVERVEWDTSSYCIMSIIAAGQPCGLAGSVSGVQPQALAQGSTHEAHTRQTRVAD
jgi:hypothetical protein